MHQAIVPDRRSATRVRYLVLAWLCLLATLSYVHRGCIAVPADLIQEKLRLSKDDMAWIMSAFFLGYTVFQIPSGWIGDRWGTRRTLTLFIILWSLATGWMGLTAGFLGLFLSRLVNGIAQAGIFPCSVKSISHWFPEQEKSFPSGMLGSFMSVGSVIATALTGFLLAYVTWEQMFIWISLPGVVIAAVFFWWFRDEPDEHSWVSPGELAMIRQGQHSHSSGPSEVNAPSLWAILLSPTMILICAQQFARAAGYIFYLTWFPTFLQKTRQVSVEDSGYLTSLALLGVVIGAAAGGYLADWIYRVTGSKQLSRRGVALVSLSVCGVLIWIAYGIDDALFATIILALSSLCAGLAGSAAYTVTIDLGGRHVATVFSTMNMMGNLGAFLMPLVVARLVDWYSWNEALLLLAGLYFAATGCWVLVQVKDQKQEQDKQLPFVEEAE